MVRNVNPLEDAQYSSKRMPSLTDALVVFTMLVALLGLPVWFAARAYYRAKSFNEQTGGNVSAWDAMWIELRVTGEAKHETP